MKKVNKKKKHQNSIIPIVIIVLVTILAISGALLVYIYTQNYIVIEKVKQPATVEKGTTVSPIIVNNAVIGGVTDTGKFTNYKVASSNMKILESTELDMYKKNGKIGTYEIKSVKKIDDSLTSVIPFKDISAIEYVAVLSSEKNIMLRETVELKGADEDEKYVKKALGKYRLFNNTVKINEVNEVYLTTDEKTRIICATSKGDTTFGAYSAIIAVKGKEAKIMKYAYVKNTESSINWPIYSLSFVCDLNGDETYELIVQETKEQAVKYSVIEYKKGQYYEVVGTDIKIK